MRIAGGFPSTLSWTQTKIKEDVQHESNPVVATKPSSQRRSVHRVGGLCSLRDAASRGDITALYLLRASFIGLSVQTETHFDENKDELWKLLSAQNSTILSTSLSGIRTGFVAAHCRLVAALFHHLQKEDL